LEQSYVFYEESSTGGFVTTSPAVEAREISCEPKLALTVPIKFLEVFKSSMERSLEAWKHRYQIERIRQGRFFQSTEANQYNWRQIKVKVIESKIRYSDINPNNSNITYIPVSIEEESNSNRVTTYKRGGFMGPKINEKEPNSFVQVQVQDEYELYLESKNFITIIFNDCYYGIEYVFNFAVKILKYIFNIAGIYFLVKKKK
jgi:hypothetical protein